MLGCTTYMLAAPLQGASMPQGVLPGASARTMYVV
jgi:hypothetical protein